MSWLVGAAVAAAVATGLGPRGRPPRALVRPTTSPPGPGQGVRGALRRRHVPRRWSTAGPELASVLTDVSARLRAGADPTAAWGAVLGRPVGAGGPSVDDLRPSPDARAEAAAVVAAGRLAAELGAPLAPLLDGVAGQLAVTAEVDGERRAALAGPRATARVLTWLPTLGVALGVAVGADPVAVLLDGSVGTSALVAGVVLLLVGRVWTGALARRAAAAGRVR